MPIYKVRRSGAEDRRIERNLAKWRWSAVAVSLVLLGGAAVMFLLAHH